MHYLPHPGPELALLSGLLGWLFSGYLTQPGEVLGWWPGFVQRLPLPGWAHKPLYACGKCVAGQVALWWALGSGLGAGAGVAALLAMAVAVVLERWVG
jgi:hypothetical protein